MNVMVPTPVWALFLGGAIIGLLILLLLERNR